MANVYNTATHTKIRAIFDAIRTATGVEMNFLNSPGFSVKLTVNPDGQSVVLQSFPLRQGPSDPYTTDANGKPIHVKAKVLRWSDLP